MSLARVAKCAATGGVRAVAAAKLKSEQVLARIPFVQGDALTKTQPTMYTIAAGPNCHVLVDEPWVKLNHSFDPNCRVGVSLLRHPQLEAEDPSLIAGFLDVTACRDIQEGENLEFDYCTTEYEMSSPFVDADTGRLVAGFKHLTPAEQEEYMPRISMGVWREHLRHVREGSNKLEFWEHEAVVSEASRVVRHSSFSA